MERKSSLLIGRRTQRDFHKEKQIRQLEDGGDRFEDYWTDADSDSSIESKQSNLLSELPVDLPIVQSSSDTKASYIRNSSPRKKINYSPLKSNDVHSPLKYKSVDSPLKSKAFGSPLKSKTFGSPLKSKAVGLPLKSKAVGSPLKSKAVGTPLKSKAVGSPLKSKAVGSPLKSKAVGSPLKSKAVGSPLKSKAVGSPLKSKAVGSPLKSKAVGSPLKSKAVGSPLKSKAVRSPLKSVELFPNNINRYEINKENYTTISEDITVNLGINDDNLEFGALNKIADDTDKNLSAKLSEIRCAAIQESKNGSSFSPPLTNNHSERPMLRSVTIFKTSKKSIARSTKKDAKVQEQQLEFDEYDQKIMQMVHMKCNESSEISVTSEKEISSSIIHDCSVEVEERSEYESEIENVSENTKAKESLPDSKLQNHNESQSISLERNPKSFNQRTFISKKNLPPKKKGTVETIHFNENEIDITSEPIIDTSGAQINRHKSANENSVPDCLPTPVNSPGNINDIAMNDVNDHPSKNLRSRERNENVHSHKAMNESSVPDYVNTPVNSPESTNNIVSNDVDDHPSKDLRKKERKKNAHSHKVVNKSSVPDCINNTLVNFPQNTNDDDHHPSKRVSNRERNDPVDQHMLKAVIHKRSLSRSSKTNKNKPHEIDALGRSKTSVETITPDNENISKKAFCSGNDSSGVYMAKKHKTKRNKKSGIISSKDIPGETGFNDTYEIQNTKNRNSLVVKRKSIMPKRSNPIKTSKNFSNESDEQISEDNIEKRSEKLRKVKSTKKAQTTTDKTSCMIGKDIERAELDSLSLSITPKAQKTNSFTAEGNDYDNMSPNLAKYSSKNVSEVNIKRKSRKQDSHNEGVELDCLSEVQTSQQRKRSSFVNEENNARVSLSSSKNSVNVPGVTVLSTKNKHSRDVRKTATNKKSGINKEKSYDNISETSDSSKNQSNKNEYSNDVQKRVTSKRSGVMLSDDNISETSDSAVRRSKRQKTLTDKSNGSVSQENSLANAPGNSSEKSVNIASEVNIKKGKKKQNKITKDKNRLENQNSPEKVAKKSKSSLAKNNLNKENGNSEHPFVRRSSRQRFAPLARWRNERLIYRFENGNIETVGIDKGTKEDTAFIQSLYNTIHNRKKEKKKILKPKKVKILDVIEQKEKHVVLHKKFPLVDWDPPIGCKIDENASYSYLIKRMFETRKNSFGYINIEVGKKKPPQFMPEDDLLLIVIEGDVEISIQNSLVSLERKDMFIVPRSSAYSITNVGRKKALLSYVVGQFKFLENL